MVSLLLIVLFGVAAIVLLLAPQPARRLRPVARLQPHEALGTPIRAVSVIQNMSRVG
jgi:hypothetical protein